MNKGKLLVVLAGIAFAPVAAHAAAWGGNEVRQASAAALDHFRQEKGGSLFDTVSGVSVEVTSQGNAARAKVTYTEGGVKKSASSFCHVHDGSIDCH